MDYFQKIKTLCDIPSASGFEQTAGENVKALFTQAGLKVETDPMGNVYGIKSSGKQNAKTILLDAHYDEIGFIVTGHKNGFLKFDTLGGVDPRVLPARRVRIVADKTYIGVFTCLPPHLVKDEDAGKAFDKDSLYIDTGLSQQEAEELIPIGTPCVFDSDCVKLDGEYICARALDDRASLVALLSACEMLKNDELNVNIVLCASVQEEVGCRGATVSSYRISPDYAIAVDVTHGTTPDSGKKITFDLSSGASIGVGPNFDRKMSDKLILLAKEKGIAHTVEVCAGESGTNAWPMQITKGGVSTALISLPLRYMHTPCEVISEKDLDAVARLVCEYIKDLSKEVGENA